MAKRITVSVSDALGAKIEHWKGKISPSEVFQVAIGKEIEEKENFNIRLEGDAEMETTIERFRKEKVEFENHFFKEGQEEGLRWAKATSYASLRYAAESVDRNFAVSSIYRDRVLGDYWRDCLNADPATTPPPNPHNLACDDQFPDAADRWLEGWFDAVDAVWEKV